MAELTEVLFVDQLPACCRSGALRLPRPDEAVFDVLGSFGRSHLWFAGFDGWDIRIGVSWDDDAVADAVRHHVGGTAADVESVLAAHGVGFDDEGYGWVGELSLLMARVGSSPSGSRRSIRSGFDLWDAADEVAGDLEKLVGPLAALREDSEDGLLSSAVCAAWPDAIITSAVMLLRSARVTPVMRGHLLAAWAAAQAIELFDDGEILVAAHAAPLERRDAVQGLTPGRVELTPAELEMWNAEQERLARHWHTSLGLVPLAENRDVLTWHTAYRNPAIDQTRQLWD